MGVHELSGPERTPVVAFAVAKLAKQLDCSVDEAVEKLESLSTEHHEVLQATAARVFRDGVRPDEYRRRKRRGSSRSNEL